MIGPRVTGIQELWRETMSPGGVLPLVLSTVQRFVQHFGFRLCFLGRFWPARSTLLGVLINNKR